MGTTPPAPPPWKPGLRHVLGMAVAFFASIVVLRPWLNASSDLRVAAAAAWLLFVAVVTVRTAMLSVR